MLLLRSRRRITHIERNARNHVEPVELIVQGSRMVCSQAGVSMNPKAATMPQAADRWVNQVHTIGRFGVGYGCAHCGVVFMGCRSMTEAGNRLEIHRAVVREEDERRERGGSNLLSEDDSL